MASWKITSDFPQLPGDNDANRIAIYQAVYAQLDAMGIAHPGTPAANISHDNMLKHFRPPWRFQCAANS